MSISLRRLGMGVLAFGMLAMLAACVASVGYVGDDAYEGPTYVGVGYGYGGWDHYHVGPPRGGERRPEERAHSYRPADRSRSTPSIPNRAHHH
jgi:hypothetical protein